jgi:hypothetical protein
MPSRRRHRQQPTTTVPVDPVTQFGQMLQESAAREAEAARRAEQQRADAKAAQRAAQEHAEALRSARRELDRAIDAVRRARSERRGEAEADAAWREAKARVIELETGARPEWATGAERAEASGDDDAGQDGTAPDQPDETLAE